MSFFLVTVTIKLLNISLSLSDEVSDLDWCVDNRPVRHGWKTINESAVCSLDCSDVPALDVETEIQSGHSVSIQRICRNFPAWPPQNLINFHQIKHHQMSVRKHAESVYCSCTADNDVVVTRLPGAWRKRTRRLDSLRRDGCCFSTVISWCWTIHEKWETVTLERTTYTSSCSSSSS